MSKAQIHIAVHRVMSLCDEYQTGYRSVSMRSALETLGYDRDAQDEIVRAVAEEGFQYCLDPIISATHFDPNNPQAENGMITDFPNKEACYWGPDQLKSRLHCTRYGNDYGRNW
jgi:hypothetical protein